MTLIYDIETKTFGRPDPTKDEYRVFGYYDVEADEQGVIFGNIEEVKKLIGKHKIIIGFNNKNYDNPILERAGINLNYHTVIDLFKIFKDKAEIMGLKLRRYSLANIAKYLKISEKEEDFDYSILKKDEWTDEDIKKIKKYTIQDIIVTVELWNYVKKFFEPFKEFINESDAKNFKHVSLSSGAYAYKVICKEVGMEEKYGNIYGHEKYQGGYVATPSKELNVGKIYCLDFNSMYPHAYIQGNLFSYNCKCCTEKEKYTGGKLFKLKGQYCTKNQGKIEEVIKRLYKLRQQYKKMNDPREHTIKIVINTMYGISGNPNFVNLYNVNTASDCTHIARTCIKLAREKYKNAGYNVIYSDTDSVYIEDVRDDEKIMLTIKDDIVREIKNSMPFPQDTFDMGIDERIKLLYFPGLKKKNYIYVREDNSIKIKGLPIKKSNASPLSMLIFEKYIKNELIKTGKIKFEAKQIKDWIYKELENDISLAAIEFNVMSIDAYKNTSTIQAQISAKYGPGQHKLIPNIFGVGIGRGKSYCSVQEFKDSGLKLNAIELSKTFSELNPFSDLDMNEMYISKSGNKVINTLARWV